MEIGGSHLAMVFETCESHFYPGPDRVWLADGFGLGLCLPVGRARP